MSRILFTWGSTWAGRPPWNRYNPRQVPPGQVHALAGTPPGRYILLSRYPLGRYTPHQVPPRQVYHPQVGTPPGRYTPRAGTPPAGTPPRYYKIRSMSGRYASYWNAFLFFFAAGNFLLSIRKHFGTMYHLLPTSSSLWKPRARQSNFLPTWKCQPKTKN